MKFTYKMSENAAQQRHSGQKHNAYPTVAVLAPVNVAAANHVNVAAAQRQAIRHDLLAVNSIAVESTVEGR